MFYWRGAIRSSQRRSQTGGRGPAAQSAGAAHSRLPSAQARCDQTSGLGAGDVRDRARSRRCSLVGTESRRTLATTSQRIGSGEILPSDVQRAAVRSSSRNADSPVRESSRSSSQAKSADHQNEPLALDYFTADAGKRCTRMFRSAARVCHAATPKGIDSSISPERMLIFFPVVSRSTTCSASIHA